MVKFSVPRNRSTRQQNPAARKDLATHHRPGVVRSDNPPISAMTPNDSASRRRRRNPHVKRIKSDGTAPSPAPGSVGSPHGRTRDSRKRRLKHLLTRSFRPGSRASSTGERKLIQSPRLAGRARPRCRFTSRSVAEVWRCINPCRFRKRFPKFRAG